MLHFSTRGRDSGPIIVFLHAVGISSWMWQSVVEHLPEFESILIDLPGHGQSRDIPWIDIEDSANKIDEIISKIRDDRDVHLVGLSLGAYVGLKLLTLRPDMFSTAMLSGLHAGGMQNKWLMKAMSYIVAPLATRPAFARKNARMLGGDDLDLDAFVVEAVKTRAAAFRRASIDVVNFEAPLSLDSIKSRTLLVAGGNEHPLILQSLGRLHQRIPGSVSVTVPGVGHGWSGEKPLLFAQILKDHIHGLVPDANTLVKNSAGHFNPAG